MRYLLNFFFALVLIYVWSFLDLLQINDELSLPYLNIPSAYSGLAIMVIGTALFQVAKEILGKLYVLFIFASCGIGCLTLPVYMAGVGSILLWIVAQLGFWQITASPFVFLLIGFVTAFAQIPARLAQIPEATRSSSNSEG